jgi:hypothetical protein
MNVWLFAPNLQVWRAGQSADNFLVSRAGTTVRHYGPARQSGPTSQIREVGAYV